MLFKKGLSKFDTVIMLKMKKLVACTALVDPIFYEFYNQS